MYYLGIVLSIVDNMKSSIKVVTLVAERGTAKSSNEAVTAAAKGGIAVAGAGKFFCCV
jgi:hypothetical protein